MEGYFAYVVVLILGLAPSIVWLFYYLRKDCHPEPKYLIIKTFLMGIIVSPLAIIAQQLFVEGLRVYFPQIEPKGPEFYLWAAFIEELVKFYAVMHVALYSSEFDEPVDAMIYMIVAGLGFAAMENILVMFKVIPDQGIKDALGIWGLRFAGATLLHALSCAIVGYFIGLAWFFEHHAKKLIVLGIVLASLFHFVFNMTLVSQILDSGEQVQLLYTLGLLVVMSFMVSVLFDKIKKRHSQTSPLTVQA